MPNKVLQDIAHVNWESAEQILHEFHLANELVRVAILR
jgi:hypothetical protein